MTFPPDFLAVCVNASGDVGGSIGGAPIVWQHDAGPVALPLPPGATSGRVRDINNTGGAVGTALMAGGATQGVVWLGGGVGWPAGGQTVLASARRPAFINDVGLVAYEMPGVLIAGLTETGYAYGSYIASGDADYIASYWPLDAAGWPAGPASALPAAPSVIRGLYIAGLSDDLRHAAVSGAYGGVWHWSMDGWQDVGPGQATRLQLAATGDHYDVIGRTSPGAYGDSATLGAVWHPRVHGHYGETVLLAGTWQVLDVAGPWRLVSRRDGRCEVLPRRPAADMNGDGAVNNFDIDPFLATLGLGGPAPAQIVDFDSDGAVTFFDADHFVAELLGR